jgi:hypothetical protein
MAKTNTFTVDNVGNPEAVTADIACSKITVREQGAAGTTDYNVRAPSMTDAVYRKVAGESTVFQAPPGVLFQPGDAVGYLETLSGSVTFSKICE